MIKKIMPKKIGSIVLPMGHCLLLLSNNPLDYRKMINLITYYKSLCKKEKINFVPPTFNVAISSRCNLRCPTCYYGLRNPNVFSNGKFISIDNFNLVIDKYAPFVERILLSGGEPLLHPELDTLIEIIKRNGLSVSVSTNGTLIKKKIGLMKLFSFINVSLDGYNYETYKDFRGGTKKQFDDILNGLKLLNDNDIKFQISFLLTEENLDQIHEMIAFAYKIKPNSVVFQNINPHGSAKFRPITVSEKVDHAFNKIIGIVDYPFDILLPTIFDVSSKNFRIFKCDIPWTSCLFNDEGNISYCNHLWHDGTIGNILKEYDFNSDKMQKFRRLIINNQCPATDCLYCHHRFLGDELGYFDSKMNRWFLR